MKAVVLKERKGYNDLTTSDVPDPRVGVHDVLVRVKYAGINYADILATQGLYSWQGEIPHILGLDGSGVVEKVGRKVTKYKVGDRVIIGGKTGTYAELTSRHENSLWRIPKGISFEEATSLPANWFTAWLAIFELARCRKGEVALIQSAAGGVGTAACQLARSLGMKVYGTASTPAKKAYLRKLGVIPLNYEDFDKKIQPDFILESVGGDVHRRSLKSLAPLGKLVSIGMSSIKVQKWNPFSWLKAWMDLPRVKRSDLNIPGYGYMSLHVGYLFEEHREKIEPAWERMGKYMVKNKLRPKIHKESIYPMSKVSEAFELIDNRKNIGKVLLDPTR